MSDILNKTVRTKCDIKVEVYQDNKRKYAILYDFNTNSKNIGYLITKGNKMDSSMSDDEIIQETLKRLAITDNEINIRNNPTKFRDFYTIEQDPWSDVVATKRHYGFTLYYLNNGCSVELKWLNSDNTLSGSYSDDCDSSITKYLKLYLPSGVSENKGGAYITVKSGVFYYDQESKYPGIMKDKDIINELISSYKTSISKIHGDNNYNLDLCLPDTMSCSIIPYKSPILAPENTLSQTINNLPVGITQSSKFLMEIVGLPKLIQVKALENLPEFTIYVIEKSEDLPYNPDEENVFAGEEETGLTFEEYKMQENVSNGQIDCSKDKIYDGGPVEIIKTKSFNELIDLAGKCARSLGKNGRVNSENMKKGYIKGIHGLCPQGTQAVLYALTGIKKLGQLTGNADWFSFKSPTIPAGGENKGNFYNTGYYQDKVRIVQNEGSWKGTYLKTKSMWQIGDIIAMGYTDRSYGHIQVWTGYSWMSDFKQGDSIQQNHVDPYSVALWRLNAKGVDAIRKLS